MGNSIESIVNQAGQGHSLVKVDELTIHVREARYRVGKGFSLDKAITSVAPDIGRWLQLIRQSLFLLQLSI